MTACSSAIGVAQSVGRQARWLAAAGLVFLILVHPVWAGEPPEHQLDCRVYDTRQHSITLGLKAGNFLFSVGPQVTFGLTKGIVWERAVQGIIARYVEACNRYNAGMVTQAEYETRLREIDGLYREAQDLEAKLFAATRRRAQAATNELDETLGHAPRESQAHENALDEAVEQLARRVETLAPIGRTLKPAPPCPPPDMLGAPGVQSGSKRTC